MVDISTLQEARRHLGNEALRLFFENLSRAGSLLPQIRRLRAGLRCERDLVYGSTGQKLDVWLPAAGAKQKACVLYLHGGGFRILSKQTHWPLAAMYAQAGFTVFNADYRLSPRHSFPAAVEDACEAYLWVQRNAARYGADPTNIIVAGESAGANLALVLAVAATFKRPELYARAVFDAGIVPSAVVPMCGILQVSRSGRFAERKRLPRFASDRIFEVEKGYLGGQSGEAIALADPLVILESETPSERAFPRVYAAVGTADPILDDTRRLDKALERRKVEHQVSVFPGEIHAFHALLFRRAARDSWRETFSFLGSRSAI